ncbi:MAG: gamma-glutamylcyclotransferase [Acidimicrobiales bacterium]
MPGPGGLLAVYGTLMTGLAPAHQPPVGQWLEPVGAVHIPGRLYEVHGGSFRYPALSLERLDLPTDADPGARPPVVHGELFRVLDRALFDVLDRWEGYDPTAPAASPYFRRLVRMLRPSVDAWVYVGNHEDRSHWIAGGSWRAHVETTA